MKLSCIDGGRTELATAVIYVILLNLHTHTHARVYMLHIKYDCSYMLPVSVLLSIFIASL